MSSRIVNAKRNIIGLMINRIISLLLPFFTRTAIIYYLGTVYLGLNSLFTSLLSVLSLAELGVGTAMVFSMYEPIANGDDTTVCALLRLYRKIYYIIGTIILIIGIIFAPFLTLVISGEYPNDINIYAVYLINLFNTVISYYLFAYKDSLLTANQRIDILSMINSVICCILNIGQTIILIKTKNYYMYCLFMVVTTIISNLIRSYIISKKYPRYRCQGTVSHEMLNDIKKRVTGLFIYKVCDVLRFSLDSIVLSAFLGLTVLAKYNNYYYIMNAIAGTMAIVSNSITATIGNSIIKESQEKNYKDFKRIQLIYMWIAGLCSISLFCLYQPFMNFWVGKELMFDNVVMVFFCIYFFVNRWGDMCYAYRQGAGLWWQDKFRPIVESIVNISLNIILVQKMGVIGVLLSTIIGLVFINSLWGSKILFKHYFTEYKQFDYLKRLMLYTVITALACIATYGVCLYIEGVIKITNSVVELIVRALICCIIPNTIFFIVYKNLSEFKESMSLLKQLFFTKIKI